MIVPLKHGGRSKGNGSLRFAQWLPGALQLKGADMGLCAWRNDSRVWLEWDAAARHSLARLFYQLMGGLLKFWGHVQTPFPIIHNNCIFMFRTSCPDSKWDPEQD